MHGVRMKLAEALILRADTQKNLAQIRARLVANAKVQEGDSPAESPTFLLAELDEKTVQLEALIKQINKTNALTVIDGKSLADMLVERDVLITKVATLREFAKEAADKLDRYSTKEIKVLSTVNVAEMQRNIDALSKVVREMDTRIQGLNWTTEIL